MQISITTVKWISVLETVVYYKDNILNDLLSEKVES